MKSPNLVTSKSKETLPQRKKIGLGEHYIYIFYLGQIFTLTAGFLIKT